ncbi:MAG: general stress protein [Fretibacterium sp.]|nr:general stress protein [Fretibacterium sp.]
MQINSYGYSGSASVAASRLSYAQFPTTKDGQEKGAAGSVPFGSFDSYLHDSIGDFSQSGVYGAPAPIPGGETGSGDDSLMSRMSDTFRANEDSIRAAMEDLGLSEEDLAEAENMALLANAMNEGAAKLGVPQVEDLDAAVEELMSVQSSGSSTEETTAEATGVAGGAGGAGAPAGAGRPGGAGNPGASSGSEEESDESTSKVVIVNGTAYMETTTVKDGVTSKSLTPLGGGSSFRQQPVQASGDSGLDPKNMPNFGSYHSLGMYTLNISAA